MVRSVVIEDSLRNDFDQHSNADNSCSILIGTVQADKRFVLGIYHVPVVDDVKKDTEFAVNGLLFALPGGCYPLGVITESNVLALSSIVKKVLSKLALYVRIEDKVSETVVLCKSGNKLDGKILVDGQFKPITVKYMSFISYWKEISMYTSVIHYLDLSERWNMLSYIKVLKHSHLLLGGLNNDFLDEAGKEKNSPLVLHPTLLLPLIKEGRNGSDCCYGKLYSHVWVHSKLTIEQIREVIVEDLVKSIISRVNVFHELDETHYNNTSKLKLPYRVTFPLGAVELSVYLLQDEKLSHASEVVKDIFNLYPTNLKAKEECKEDIVEEVIVEEDNKLMTVILGSLGAILAILIAALAILHQY